MGFELLTDETDNNEGDSEEESPLLISRMFEESFPYYLSIGMTSEEYWDGDPSLVASYRKAHDIMTHRKNTEMWFNGRYIYEAMCCLIPSHQLLKPKPPLDYPKEPFPITEQDVKEREKREELERQKALREKIQNQMMAFKNRPKKQEEPKDG